MIAVALVGMILWGGLEPVPQQIKKGFSDIKKSIFWDFNKKPTVNKYGIDIGDLYICTGEIKQNESLGEILGENGIPKEVVSELVEKSNGILDVTKIRAGKSYCLMRSSDTLDKVKYFIYEQDPVNYVVYELGDSLSVRSGSKHVEVVERQASGVIMQSMWRTLEENDLDPQLAISMSEIYAWSIDFFRLQKGDFFKVIFDEQYVEGQRIGVGEIRGAVFNHAGKDFYAVKFEQDSSVNFFDETGASLKKSFLKAPLQFRRISSNFNHARFHPILKIRRPHLGTDYAAEVGTPIWSIGNGVVVQATFNRGSGNFVEIKHNGTYTTKYLHMSRFAEGIRAGAHVTQGQVIGYVGMTGLATGPHLHFEMLKNGVHTDATKEDLPQGDPIKAECSEAYRIYQEQIVGKLKAMPQPKERKSSERSEKVSAI